MDKFLAAVADTASPAILTSNAVDSALKLFKPLCKVLDSLVLSVNEKVSSVYLDQLGIAARKTILQRVPQSLFFQHDQVPIWALK